MSNTLYFYIKDLKHQNYLVAKDKHDGFLYHQPENIAKGRPEAQWAFELVDPATVGSCDVSYYRIKDKKHGKYIVAGDQQNNKIYHQDPGTRMNAMWGVEFGKTARGFQGFKVTDALHNKNLVAGDRYDGHVYHQDDGTEVRPEKRWKIELVEKPRGDEVYPNFYLLPGSMLLESLEIGEPLADISQPDVVMSTKLINGSSVSQTLSFKKETTKTMEESVSTSSTWGLKVLVGVQINFGSITDALARASVKVEVESSYSQTSATSYRASNAVTYSIDAPVKVPARSAIEAKVTMSQRKQTLPFTATVRYRLANNIEKTDVIKGQWVGVMVTDCTGSYLPIKNE